MRQVSVKAISDAVCRMCFESNCILDNDVYKAIEVAKEREDSPLGKSVLGLLLENASLAKEKQVALCQDTGMVVVFLEIGQEVHLIDGPLEKAVNEGVRRAYAEYFFRKSVVDDPLLRKNTNDNTPAVIHASIVPGDKVAIKLASKGFGSENMSALKMLKPADGLSGVKDFVISTVKTGGGNPCPPIIVGVGIGGTMEKAALLGKQALFRPLGSRHPKPHLHQLEEELLEMINLSGVGPQGYGGSITALDVFVETYPTHIAGLPVAVNINCHVSRHREVVI